jgi:hypothetical protein
VTDHRINLTLYNLAEVMEGRGLGSDHRWVDCRGRGLAPGGARRLSHTYDALLRDTAVALTAAGIDNARFEARLLLAHASGLAIEQLVARGTDEVPTAIVTAVRSLTARRVRREPMAYILGEREFWGLPFKVTPAVLVPRPDSETVIEAVLALMPDRDSAWRILDLGLGSGCLLLTLLREYPRARGIGLETRPRRWRWPRRTRSAWVLPTGRGWWPATGASRVGKGYWLDRSI